MDKGSFILLATITFINLCCVILILIRQKVLLNMQFYIAEKVTDEFEILEEFFSSFTDENIIHDERVNNNEVRNK